MHSPSCCGSNILDGSGNGAETKEILELEGGCNGGKEKEDDEAERETRESEEKREEFCFYATLYHVSHNEWDRLAPLVDCHVDYKRREVKFVIFTLIKICLNLCAKAPVSAYRVSLPLTGVVSKGRQIIYQNAQNEALNVV